MQKQETNHYELPLLTTGEIISKDQKKISKIKSENFNNFDHNNNNNNNMNSIYRTETLESTPFITKISKSKDSKFDLDDSMHLNSNSNKIFFCELKSIVEIIESFPMQIIFSLMYIYSFFLIVYDLFLHHENIITINTISLFIIVSIFILENALMFSYKGKNQFGPPFRRKIIFLIDCGLLLAFILQLIILILWFNTKKIKLIYIEIAIIFLIFFPRVRQFILSLRRRVSSERRRYINNGFDLDLTFINNNIVATSWPASKYEYLFRNNAKEVENLLDLKYGINSYHVFNLCSERIYKNSSLFHGNYSIYPMDDHNPAELQMILNFVQKASEFINKNNERNGIVVHCKGGKGRTGTMICAYILYNEFNKNYDENFNYNSEESLELNKNSDEALELFANRRTAIGGKFQGVQTPSQERYVRYFEKILLLIKIQKIPLSLSLKKPKFKRITQMILKNIPFLWWKGGIGKLWFVIILKPCTERRVIYISNPHIIFNYMPINENKLSIWNKFRDIIIPSDESLYRESQKLDTSKEISSYEDTFSVQVNNEIMNSTLFDNKYNTDSLLGNNNNNSLKVTLETLQLKKIPPICDDVVIKFYYAKKNPNPLNPPVQFWFHTSMEGEKIKLDKIHLDGPHKDIKGERYPNDFTVILRLKDELTAQ